LFLPKNATFAPLAESPFRRFGEESAVLDEIESYLKG
jgi:hypothetical protein